MELPIEDWSNAFRLINSIWTDPKFRTLQFKIINRIVGVASYSSRVTGQSSDCTFCRLNNRMQRPESPEHAFYFCPTTYSLLQQLISWEPLKILEAKLDPFSILIWTKGTTPQHQFCINSIWIWTKAYLFSCIMKKTLPNIIGARRFITYQAQDIDWTLKSHNKPPITVSFGSLKNT